MATSDKCPRCDCEGNRLACEMCYYYGFKCPGNCACCREWGDPPAQKKAAVSNVKVQRDSTQKQAKVSNSNDRRDSAPKIKRAPLRPLILRNVKKALAESQKKASSNVSQSKAENSSVSESSVNKGNLTENKLSSNKVNSAVNESNSNKGNSTVAEKNENKVNLSEVKQSKKAKVNTGTQTPNHGVTYVIEPELPDPYKEYARKENEEMMRLWKGIFWPQWDKVPCEPFIPPETGNPIRRPNIISKEKLEEGINGLIGDHCLNCQCKNPRESCDICRRTDFQCLGTCICCLPFRAGQRFMIFITRGLYQLPDGSLYGGGSVNLSLAVPQNSEVTDSTSNASKHKLNLSRSVTEIAVSALWWAISITLNSNNPLLPGMFMNVRRTVLILLDSEI